MVTVPITVESPLVTWRGGLDDGTLECVGADLAPLVLTDVIGKLSGSQSWSGQAAAILAAHGVFLACQRHPVADDLESVLDGVIAQLRAARPTCAVLAHACERLRVCWAKHVGQLDGRELCARLLMEARRWQRETINLQERTASQLLAALPDRGGVLIAGTAASHPGSAALLGVINAVRSGRRLAVQISGSVDQLAPRWADAALTRANVPHATIAEAELPAWFAARRVQVVLIGADAIMSDGAVISDPGSALLSELALAQRAQVIVASPTTAIGAIKISPDSSSVIPAARIQAIVTEHGIIRAPFVRELARLRPSDEIPPAV